MQLNEQHESRFYDRRIFEPSLEDDDRFPPPPDNDERFGDGRYDGGALGHHAPKPIPLRWHRDADPNAERDWLVKELLSTVGKGLLSGQWGSSKTFVALDLSGCVMTGEPFAGRKVLRRGGVLFIAPEGAFEIPVRLRGLVAGKIAGTALAQAVLGQRSVDPDDLPFAWVEECPRLVEADSVEHLALTAEAAAAEMRERYDLPLVLIIIDTVAAGAGFDDENSAAETQKVMNALEALSHRTGAFVLGVDHFGKAVETGTRGSSAKEAAADTVLAMLANKDEAGNVSNTRMAVRKVRGARTGIETPYSLEVVEIGTDRFGEPITTCVVSWQEGRGEAAAAAVKERWPATLKVFRQALTNAVDEHGIRAWPYGQESQEQKAVPFEKVRAAFYSAYRADGATEAARSEAKRKSFNRAVKMALERSLVGSIELQGIDHLWLVQEGSP
jgi:hypothetical protein